MAWVFSLSVGRDGCYAEFPSGSARELVSQWGPGPARRFPADSVPKEVVYRIARKTASDVLAVDGLYALCPELKDRVDELEPGIHQFFPVNVVRPGTARPIFRLGGSVLDKPYHVLNVGTRVDAVDLEKSDVEVFTFPDRTLIAMKPGKWNTIVLKRAVIAGIHVWRGQNQLFQHYFMSNELASTYFKSKMRGLQLVELAEA